MTAVSWHGVLLAEVARLSPPGRIGATTGAVLAFGDAGSLVLPLLFSAALSLTGGYSSGFLIGAALALGSGLPACGGGSNRAAWSRLTWAILPQKHCAKLYMCFLGLRQRRPLF